jgi:hypothetical protein
MGEVVHLFVVWATLKCQRRTHSHVCGIEFHPSPYVQYESPILAPARTCNEVSSCRLTYKRKVPLNGTVPDPQLICVHPSFGCKSPPLVWVVWDGARLDAHSWVGKQYCQRNQYEEIHDAHVTSSFRSSPARNAAGNHSWNRPRVAMW